jgi:hypothetical protein
MEQSRAWSWFKVLMLALLRGWIGSPSGSSDFPGHPPQGEHLIWRCSQWIPGREIAVG